VKDLGEKITCGYQSFDPGENLVKEIMCSRGSSI